MDTRFDSLDKRVEVLEVQGQRRALETKPIWERALAEIGEVKSELGEVKSELVVVKNELGEVKVELREVKVELGGVKHELSELKDRVGALEDTTALLGHKLDIFNIDLSTLRAKEFGLEFRVEKLESKETS